MSRRRKRKNRRRRGKRRKGKKKMRRKMRCKRRKMRRRKKKMRKKKRKMEKRNTKKMKIRREKKTPTSRCSGRLLCVYCWINSNSSGHFTAASACLATVAISWTIALRTAFLQ